MDNSNEKLNEFAEINYLTPENSAFTRTRGGFVSLELEEGKAYPKVSLFKSFPFTGEGEFISVRDEDTKEIGMIRRIGDFPSETVEILYDELRRRYFTPVIQKINTIKEEFGCHFWEVETSAGPRKFTTRRNETMGFITGGRVLLVDVDGNRYEIPDYYTLDSRYIKIIETFT